MAKETLREYLNRKIKSSKSTLAEEKKKASKYKSISAAKKAGALYYTNKDGKVMAAVFAEDLKQKLGSPATSKITITSLNDKPGARDEKIPPERKPIKKRKPMNFKAAAKRKKK
tara:strand:+ start:67 stop:408 length:342 start_codon:yes stop_codon:yes gene_type:complete